MQVDKRVFWIIFFVVFIDLIGFGIVFPLLPLYTRHFQLNGFQIGLILGIYSLMQFIFAPILGRWSDRIGRRPVLLISLLGTAASFFLLAWANSFWLFFLARALDGIAGSNLSTAQAYIADISPKEQRTRNMGMWIGAAFGLGFAFGPFFGGALHWIGLHLVPSFALGFPFFVAGIITLLNALMAFFLLPESLKVRDSEHLIGRRTFSWFTIQGRLSGAVGGLIVTYASVIFAFALMEATYTWLSKDRYGLTPAQIYAMFGYLGIVMAFVQGGLVRRLAPRLGDKNLALLGGFLLMIGLASLPFGSSLPWLMVASGLMAAGEGFSNTALMASISKGSHETIQGETMGVTQSLASLSRFGGPVLAGYLYQHYGATSPYVTGAVVVLVSLGLCVMGFKRLVVLDDSPTKALST